MFYDSFNAGVLIDGSSKLQFYHKSKLVPGAELMPFGSALAVLKPFFAHFGGTTGGYGSQEKPSVFYSASGIGAAPVICYESIWGNYVAEYVKMGAQFIAVITNDGWWGIPPGKTSISYMPSYGPLRTGDGSYALRIQAYPPLSISVGILSRNHPGGFRQPYRKKLT